MPIHSTTFIRPESHGLEQQEHARQLPAQRMQKTAFSLWLDFFRSAAAFAVLLAHANVRFLVGLSSASPRQRTIPLYLFALAASFGHQAVMIFFVLSGYLVGGGLWRALRAHKILNLKQYFLKRVSRLCIVLYPALLLIALLNHIGISAFHGIASGVYPGDTLHTMRPESLACNATFFQTAFCAPYGHDVALWSLFNEFWYYLVWPVFLLGFLAESKWKRVSLLTAACAILAILTIISSGYAPIGPYMLIWLLGVLVAWLPRPLVCSYGVSVTVLIAASLGERALAMHNPTGLPHTIQLFLLDILLSSCFANLLLCLKHDNSLMPPWGKAWNTAFARFSFSLYCIHVPILNAYAAAMRFYAKSAPIGQPGNPWLWNEVFGALLLSIATAFLFSQLTEANTDRARRLVVHLLDAKARRSFFHSHQPEHRR